MVGVLLLLSEEEVVEGLRVRLGGQGCAQAGGHLDNAVPALGNANDAADGSYTGSLERAGDDAVGRHHELLDERRSAVLLEAGNVHHLAGQGHRSRFDGLKIERSMLEAAAHHALGRGVLKLELGGQIGAGSHLSRSGAGSLKPCADAVVGQLGAVADQSGVDLAVGGSAGRVYGELDDVRDPVFILVQRSNALGELGWKHGKDFDAGIDRGRLALGVAVDDRARTDARVYVGHADEHADAAIRQRLGPLDLVKILGGIVVDGGPEQAAQVLNAGDGGRRGVGLNGGEFGIGSGGKIRLESVLDHGGMGRGDKIEVHRLAGMHEESGSFNVKS